MFSWKFWKRNSVEAESSANAKAQALFKSKKSIMSVLSKYTIRDFILRDAVVKNLLNVLEMDPSNTRAWLWLVAMLRYRVPSKSILIYVINKMNETSNNLYFEESNGLKLRDYVLRLAKMGMQISPSAYTPSQCELQWVIEKKWFQTPPLFGCSIIETMNPELIDQEKGVPKLLVLLCEGIIEFGGCCTEGLFRIPADLNLLHEFIWNIEFNWKPGVDVRQAIDRWLNLNVTLKSQPLLLAGVLKYWLRTLQDSLIPYNVFKSFYKRRRSLTNEINNNNPYSIATLVKSLPDCNRRILYYLITFLKIFCTEANQPGTKMRISDLAIVFAPNIIKQSVDEEIAFLQQDSNGFNNPQCIELSDDNEDTRSHNEENHKLVQEIIGRRKISHRIVDAQLNIAEPLNSSSNSNRRGSSGSVQSIRSYMNYVKKERDFLIELIERTEVGV